MVEASRIRIRPMTLADIDRVYEVEQRSFPSPWPLQSFINDLQRKGLACYLVAEDDDRIAGYTGFWEIVDEAHITTLAVDPDFRRRHIAERLLLRLVSEAEKKGAHWLTLEVRVGNEAARALYRKFGFREIAIRKGYYSDNNEDAVVMWTGPIGDSDFRRRLQEIACLLPPEGEEVDDA